MLENKIVFRRYFGIFLLLSILPLITGSSLLYDASDYILRIALTQKILIQRDLRDVAFYLLHLPSVFYLRYLGNNFFTLSRTFELTHLLLPLFLVLLNYLTLPLSKKKYGFYHLVILFVSMSFSYFCHVSEMNLALSALLFAVIQLLVGNSWPRVLSFSLFLGISLGSYPVALSILPFIYLRFFHLEKDRFVGNKRIFLLSVLYISALFVGYTFATYTYLYPRNSDNFFGGTIEPKVLYYGLGLFVFYAFFLISSKLTRFKLLCRFLLLIIFLYLFYLYQPFPTWVLLLSRSYTTIVFSLICPMLVIFAGISDYDKWLDWALKPLAHASIIVVLALSWSMYYNNSKILIFLNGHQGIIRFESLSNEEKQLFSFGSDHTLATYSVLLAGHKKNDIKSLVTDLSGTLSVFDRYGYEKVINVLESMGVNFSPDFYGDNTKDKLNEL